MIIEKKVWPEYFQKIIEGKKKYELRLADFNIEEGDFILLREWKPETKDYTGREIKKKVSFVLKTKDIKFWPKEDINKFGLQIISFD